MRFPSLSRTSICFKVVFLFLMPGGLMPGSLCAQPVQSSVRLVWSNSTPYDWYDQRLSCLGYPSALLSNHVVDLHIDKSGNVYTLSKRQYLSEWLNTCDTCLPTRAVATKIDYTGESVWSYSAVHTNPLGFRGQIGTDSSGRVYFTEEHWADFWYGPCLNLNTGLLTVSLTADGSPRWADKHEISPDLYAGPASLLCSKAGRIYAAAESRVGSYWISELLVYGADGTGPSVSPSPILGSTAVRLLEDSRGNIFAYSDQGVAKFRADGVPIKQISLQAGFCGAGMDEFDNSYCIWYVDSRAQLIKLDSNLTEQWSVDFDTVPTRLVVDRGGSSLVLFTTHANKFDPNGIQQWYQEWTPDELAVIDARVDRLGRIFAWTMEFGYGDTVGVVGSYDPDGNLRWTNSDMGAAYPIMTAAGVGGVGSLYVDSRGDLYVVSGWNGLLIERFTQPKTLVIRDARLDSIPSTTFYLIKVHNNPPDFDEDTLGRFTTDARGQFVLPFAGTLGYEFAATAENPEADTLRFGDTLKIAGLVYTQPAVKHQNLLGTMLSVHLDNGDFLPDGSLVFDTLELGSIQEIVLRHTEYRFNLLASVEWDAELTYLQALQEEFRMMSDYLYDVSDGQMRLDTVVIVDNKQNWDSADVDIRANNEHGPDAGISDMVNPGGYPINMPRKWFFPIDQCRDSTYRLHPLGVVRPNNYRTMAHEFGHYALGFADEYLDLNGNQLPDVGPPRCSNLPAGNYGFMDGQYLVPDYGPYASEMSSRYRYQNGACQNTSQWGLRAGSCWDFLESWAERPLNGILVPILRPTLDDTSERLVPAGLEYFPGPNDDLDSLDYDVGRLVQFPVAPVPPSASNKSMHVTVTGAPAGGVIVSIDKPGPGGLVVQGRTTAAGRIWALGVNQFLDIIRASGHLFSAILPGGIAARQQGAFQRDWLFGEVQPAALVSRTETRATLSAAGDSLTLQLKSVQGSYPLVCRAQLGATGWDYGLYFDHGFSQLPQLDVVTERGDFASGSFSQGGNSYEAPVAENLTATGSATIWAVDDSSQAFFFSTPFEVKEISSAGDLMKLIGPAGQVAVHIDSSNTAIQRTLILSSPYPPLTNGLDADAVQAGSTHSFSVYPDAPFSGSNTLSLTYSDDDLRAADGATLGDESTLRLYVWDPGPPQWDLVGGQVDTVHNVVSAPITAAGVYGAFTTIEAGCPIGMTGDVNLSGSMTPADIIFLVNNVFKAGPVPQPCAAAGDVNCSGSITAADIIYLVNHVFRAGPPPCDGCTSPLAAGC